MPIHHAARRPLKRPYPRVLQVWRLLVHWQAYLPKRARKQAAVRLCGALLVSFGSTTAKRAGRLTGAAVKLVKENLSAYFGGTHIFEGTLSRRLTPYRLASIPPGRIDPCAPLDPNRCQCFALEPTAEVTSSLFSDARDGGLSIRGAAFFPGG